MSGNEPPVFGENGSILNASQMQPQSEWPKPEPQGLTGKEKKAILLFAVLSLIMVAARIYWNVF